MFLGLLLGLEAAAADADGRFAGLGAVVEHVGRVHRALA